MVEVTGRSEKNIALRDEKLAIVLDNWTVTMEDLKLSIISLGDRTPSTYALAIELWKISRDQPNFEYAMTLIEYEMLADMRSSISAAWLAKLWRNFFGSREPVPLKTEYEDDNETNNSETAVEEVMAALQCEGTADNEDTDANHNATATSMLSCGNPNMHFNDRMLLAKYNRAVKRVELLKRGMRYDGADTMSLTDRLLITEHELADLRVQALEHRLDI